MGPGSSREPAGRVEGRVWGRGLPRPAGLLRRPARERGGARRRGVPGGVAFPVTLTRGEGGARPGRRGASGAGRAVSRGGVGG